MQRPELKRIKTWKRLLLASLWLISKYRYFAKLARAAGDEKL
jgi:hypothetical protein